MGAIFLNDVEVPLSVGNFMQSLHILSASNIKLPLLVLRIVDQLNSLSQMGLQDGSTVRVSLNGTLKLDRLFRVSGWSRQPAGDGYTYTINCYWDCPKYWAGTTSAGMWGSSYDVLRTIASKCGLAFSANNTKTADNMLWMPTNQTYSEFARDVARYGYGGPLSHMVLGVDSMGIMRYRDLTSAAPMDVLVGMLNTTNDPNFVQITDFAPTTTSGTNNALSGYMHARYVQSADSSSKIDPLEQIMGFKPDSKFALLNADVRSKVERGGVSYSPIDFGNVHAKYERAKYQNTRMDMMTSLGGDFLFGQQTPLELFDNFTYVAPPQLAPTAYDGKYTIKSKIVYIAGSSYHEKIVAVKHGLEP